MDPASRRAKAADSRHLRHDAFHAPVDGGDVKRMAAAIARPPKTDILAIDIIAGAQPGNRGADVLDLAMRVYFLPRLALAAAEIAKIEGQGGQPGIDGGGGVILKIATCHHAPAMGENDCRQSACGVRRTIEGATDKAALDGEFNRFYRFVCGGRGTGCLRFHRSSEATSIGKLAK